MNATGFVYHHDFLNHLTGEGHAERPQRLSSILTLLEQNGLLKKLTQLQPGLCDLNWLEGVHPKSFIESILEASKTGPGSLDPDTSVSQGSFLAAHRAVSAALQACDEVAAGRLNNAFCAIRPPGHHAETRKAMGFCLFNNVAVAARYLQRKHGAEKILIVDWDVHHGNGTQEIFYEDPSVFYFSTHQFPFYPGTGARSETGAGRGVGATLNVPLTAGCGDLEYVTAFEKELLPAAERFKPDFILISAGFDAHVEDPLAEMRVTEEGFGLMTRMVGEMAKEISGGKIVSLLEGGYNLDALARSVARHLEELLTF